MFIANGRTYLKLSYWQLIIILKILYLQTSPDGSVTTSTILYTPLPDHTGQMLRCKAGLDTLPGSTVETAWSLKVHCKNIFFSTVILTT